MTWTYSGDPSNSDRDAVRFLVGDTDSSDEQLQNEEIDYLLSESGSVNGAAVAAAEAILANYSRLVDKSVGDLRLSYSQRKSNYEALVKKLRRRAAMKVAKPFAGGISRSQKDSVIDNSDRVPPRFHRDQFRIPGSIDDTEKDWDEDD